jgi:Zn finger protein HypA/HybF involved in hydrogenase expression
VIETPTGRWEQDVVMRCADCQHITLLASNVAKPRVLNWLCPQCREARDEITRRLSGSGELAAEVAP